MDRWAGLQRGLVDVLLGGDPEGVRTLRHGLERAIPYFAVPAERAFFNRGFSPRRQIAATVPPVWAAVEKAFEPVAVFYGTLGGGEVYVCRERGQSSAAPAAVR